MFDLLAIPRFLDPAPVIDALRHADANAATVYGGASAVESHVRRTRKLVAPAATRELIVQRLGECRETLAAHFQRPVDECEEPQFLRYETGDFFVAHQDGNTPVIHDFTRFRRISVVIFLSDPSSYGGGELVFHGRYPDAGAREPVRPEAGTLLAFRAETTHEVTPVTHGERLTVASWYRVRE